MSLSTLPPTVLATIVRTGQLELRDIVSLRLVCRTWGFAFSQQELCTELLNHFFPFAQETYDATAGRNRSDDFNTVCNRLSRLRTCKWSLNWEVSFPPPQTPGYLDGFFPPSGFHIVDTDADEGYFLTAYAEDLSPSVRVTVKNLITGQDVYVSIPREELEGIYMSHGKVLLVYSRGPNSSMFILTDCRGGGNGRTIWSASVNTTVFHGVIEGCSTVGRRRLQPVFNSHYIAFLNTLNSSGMSRIMIMRFYTRGESPETELFELQLRILPSTIISLKPDTLGHNLLIGQRFPHHQFPQHQNLHRVLLVKATSGKVTSAFNFNVARYFSLIPERDMDMFFSPNSDSVIIWGSVRCGEYRGGGILGQVMIYPVSGGTAKIRYLKTPEKADEVAGNVQTRYSPDLGVVSYGRTAAGFESLNLDFAPAGTGAHINYYNNPSSTWSSTPTGHAAPRIDIGRQWVCAESTGPNGDVTIEVMRISEPPLLAPENTGEVSKRSSWFLNSGTATGPGSSVESVFGVGMYAPDTAAKIAQVDAEELAARLKAMEKERARETKRRSWGEVKKGWKARLFGWK